MLNLGKGGVCSEPKNAVRAEQACEEGRPVLNNMLKSNFKMQLYLDTNKIR